MTDRRTRFAIGTAVPLAGIGAVIMVAAVLASSGTSGASRSGEHALSSRTVAPRLDLRVGIERVADVDRDVAGASVQAVSDAAASGNGPWLHWSVRDASYSVVFLTGLCALASALWRSQRPRTA